MREYKVLVFKDNFDGYLSLAGSTLAGKKLDLIIQMEDDLQDNFNLSSELNDWLQDNHFPPMVSTAYSLSVVNTLERLVGKRFSSFPSKLIKQIENKNGTLFTIQDSDLNYVDTADWDYVDIQDAVFNLADLPEEISTEIKTLGANRDDLPLAS